MGAACPRIGWGWGERPPNSAGKGGAAPGLLPAGMRQGQPDPRSSREAAAWPQGHELWGSRPGRGLRGQKPPWGTAEGPSTALGSSWKSCPSPAAAPRGVGTPAARWVRGCLHLASCMCVLCLGSGFGDLCIALGVRMWMPSPCLGQGHGTLARCFGAHHWDPITLLRVRTQGCLHGVGMGGTLHQGRGWTWRCLRGAGGQDKGTLARHLVSCGAPRTVLRMGLGRRSFASGLWLRLEDPSIRVSMAEPLHQGEDLGTSATGSGLGDCSSSWSSAAGSGGWRGQVVSLWSLLAGIHSPRPWGPPHRPLLPLGVRGWLPSWSTTIPSQMRRWSYFNSPLSSPDPLP